MVHSELKKSQLIGLLKILYLVIKFIKILIGLEPIYYNFANYNINPYLQDLKHIITRKLATFVKNTFLMLPYNILNF